MKRRIKLGRILIVLIVIQALLLGGWYLIDQNIQKKRHEQMDMFIASLKANAEQINQWTNINQIDEEAFDSLKNQAVLENNAVYEQVKSYENSEERLNQEDVDALSQLDSQAGLEYLGLYTELPEDYLIFLSRDYDRLAFVEKYDELNGKTEIPGALTESLDTIPHLLQWDERWGYLPYGTSTMVFAGCAPTSLAMVFSYLNQDPNITPYAIAQFSEQNGYYVDGVGTAHSLLPAAAEEYGIEWEGVPVDEASIDQALQEGKILIASVNPGHFTRVGHFIVIVGIEDGKYKVLDPNSYKNTTLWDKSIILEEASAIWAFYK